MTSESCLSLYLPLPSNTGLYTERGSAQGRESEGLRVRAMREDKVDRFKREEGEQVIKCGRQKNTINQIRSTLW